jgi:hypothetical protein
VSWIIFRQYRLVLEIPDGFPCVSGIASLQGVKRFARLGTQTAAFDLATSLASILLGLLLVNLIRPGLADGQPNAVIRQESEHFASQASGAVREKVSGAGGRTAGDFLDVFRAMLPENVIQAATYNGQMLGVITFSNLFAIRLALPLTARFRLRGIGCGATAPGVNRPAACVLASLVVLSSCGEKKEVVVTETRDLTGRDSPPKLFATSDERFRDAQPSPVKGTLPDGWLALPASQFRLLNYRFGESGMGEVWVSISSGTVLDNANRWLKQFGGTPLDPAGLEKLRAVPVAGTTGTWVEAEGEYASGMGAGPQSGFALAGVIASLDGRILTVKMVGPKAEVESAKPVLEVFAKALKLTE